MTTTNTRARVEHGLRVLGRASGVLTARARNLVTPPRAVPRRPVPFNAMFSQDLVAALEPERRSLEGVDLYLFDVMTSPRLRGQIVFEYGTLLRAIDTWANLVVLDVGTGRSTLPRWISQQGARVVTLELSKPVEMPAPGFHARVDDLMRRSGGEVRPVAGSMLSVPFEDDSFDLVSSLSVVEHLDTDLPSRNYVAYDEQTRRLRAVLDEMVRVTRPGGLVYVTSECCDYTRATFDHWRGAYYYENGPALSAAWPVGDVQTLFHDYLTSRGCELVGDLRFDPANIANDRYWTCRGPFFSGFSVLVRKRR